MSREMISREFKPGRILAGKLDRGSDLLAGLTEVCVRHGVSAGLVQALGAVEKARVGFYDQRMRTYQYFTLDGEMEILSLLGNVSLRDGKPVVHAHAIFCDASGAASGGHLMDGTIVFACEYAIQELSGEAFHRAPDEETGLPLWR